MEHLTAIVTLITEIGVLLGVIIPVIVWTKKIADGQKCQLRSEMLRNVSGSMSTKTLCCCMTRITP